MIVTLENYQSLAWDKMEQLIPAIIQHKATGAVLMQGFMNQAALEKTLSSGNATFFSRSKERLWMKGESSGNVLKVEQVLSDCDQDSLLISCTPHGPTCHLGAHSCFPEEALSRQNFLSYLETVIAERAALKPEESYTAKLLARGTARCAQKVGEEGVEVALAAATNQKEELLGECADLFYHTLVLLKDQGLSLEQVMEVLEQRHK